MIRVLGDGLFLNGNAAPSLSLTAQRAVHE